MMLSIMEGSWCYRKAPPEPIAVMPLGCINLGTTTSHPEYHGGGLLPDSLDRSIQVTVPPCSLLFLDFWGLRHISSTKILLAKDLTERDVSKLVHPSRKGTFPWTLTPGKCLVCIWVLSFV
jgi:hypothetical protein